LLVSSQGFLKQHSTEQSTKTFHFLEQAALFTDFTDFNKLFECSQPPQPYVDSFVGVVQLEVNSLLLFFLLRWKI